MSNTLKKVLKIAATAVMVIVLAVTSTTITHNKLCNNNGMSDYSYQIYRSRTELAMDGVDVRFAMAQAEAESHFGTKGVAAKTNMVWNVKAYDNRTADDMIKKGDAKTHPDMSIEPYLILLTNEYLVNGKTEYDMFDKFVDSNGKRYASNPNYETMVLNIYNRINENTKLKDLLKEYRRYKMILS